LSDRHGDYRHRRLLESTAVGDARYSAIRALRAWLWLIAVVVALAGGVVGFVLAYDAASTRWQILAGIGAGVVGALLYATIFLVLIAFLSLALELAEAVNWITTFLFNHVDEEHAD
jgi:hypothetical protein